MISGIDLRENTPARETAAFWEAAIRKLEFFLADAKVKGEGTVIVYHGDRGSSYEKKLKSAVRKTIRRHRESGKIGFYVYGENCTEENPSIRYLISKNPGIQGEEFIKNPSPDFTLVCIKA